MCLIPKGPHRGKVLVWGNHPFVAKTPTFVANQPANEYYSFQVFGIVDPAPTPAGFRFQNFLLPIEPITTSQMGPLATSVPNFFCAGQTWSPYGDLVVVGGTTFVVPPLSFSAANLTYVFNPDLASAPFPVAGAPASLYLGDMGRWTEGPDLDFPRWYPTATLTSRLNRVSATHPTEGEVVLVAGGSRQQNPGGLNLTHNSFEALRITGPSTLTTSGIDSDFTGPVGNERYTWDGPGTTSPIALPEIDWLHEYPRLHQLSNGEVFFSGYAQRGAMLDHEDPTAPNAWTKSPAQIADATSPLYSSNWHEIRHDGSSVLLPALNGVNDIVMRIGGSTDSPGVAGTPPTPIPINTTPTTEVSVGGSSWTATPPLPLPTTSNAADGGRMFANVIALPTGALLLLGGQNYQGLVNTSMTSPMIYANGSWFVDAPNVPHSPRNYHSTAVLLPDGRVMVGGGDDRLFDYEIYSPYYRQVPSTDKPTNVLFQPAPPTDPITGALLLNYNSSYGMTCTIGNARSSVAQVSLTAPGAMTHHSDMHARHVQIKTVTQSQTTFTIGTPLNDNFAPRGIYMLWVTTTTGAVSDARWVVLR